jgi:serine/threonine-protein kinase
MIGQVINGRYEILGRIGDGGMGVVYKASQQPIDRHVALKILSGELANNETTVQRFLNEARIISQLRHPNTVKLHDFGRTDDGRLFIAMELLPGGSLDARLEGGALSPLAAMKIAREVCLSLDEAHSLGVFHRDLKPENILFDEVHGEDYPVRVVDFGIAKLQVEGIEVTAPGTRLGTPEYMSPEQAYGKPVDQTTDVYSLGIILYEMLTGSVPFESDGSLGIYLAHVHDKPTAFGDLDPPLELDPELEALVMEMLAKKPVDRPSTMKDVEHRLRLLIAKAELGADATKAMADVTGEPAPVPAPRPVARKKRGGGETVAELQKMQSRQNKVVWVAIGALLIGVAVGFFLTR